MQQTLMPKENNPNDEAQLVPFQDCFTVHFYFYPNIFLQLNPHLSNFVSSDCSDNPIYENSLQNFLSEEYVDYSRQKESQEMIVCPFLKVFVPFRASKVYFPLWTDISLLTQDAPSRKTQTRVRSLASVVRVRLQPFNYLFFQLVFFWQ